MLFHFFVTGIWRIKSSYILIKNLFFIYLNNQDLDDHVEINGIFIGLIKKILLNLESKQKFKVFKELSHPGCTPSVTSIGIAIGDTTIANYDKISLSK